MGGGDEYAVEITENAAGAEFRRLVTPFPETPVVRRIYPGDQRALGITSLPSITCLRHLLLGFASIASTTTRPMAGPASRPPLTRCWRWYRPGSPTAKRVRRRRRCAGRGCPSAPSSAGGRFGTLLDCQYPHPECRLDPRFNRRTHHACRQYLGSRHGNQQGRPGRHHPRRPRALRRHGGARSGVAGMTEINGSGRSSRPSAVRPSPLPSIRPATAPMPPAARSIRVPRPAKSCAAAAISTSLPASILTSRSSISGADVRQSGSLEIVGCSTHEARSCQPIDRVICLRIVPLAGQTVYLTGPSPRSHHDTGDSARAPQATTSPAIRRILPCRPGR